MFGSSGRSANYEERTESSNLDALTKRLASDLREHMKQLKPYDIFTPEWDKMIESYQYVADVATMEEQMPARKCKEADEESLWDGEQLAIRYLLEEGKMNMVLRMLHEFKTCMYQPDAEAKVAVIASQVHRDVSALHSAARSYETHAGALLKCALSHVEAIQTVDMPELCQLMGEVLSHLLADIEAGSTNDYTGLQEVMVVYYLGAIGERLETIDEDRTMLLFCDNNITSKFVRVLSSPVAIYNRACLEVAAKALSAIAESEHFQGHMSDHLPEADDMTNLVGIEEKFFAELCKDAKFRISVRPLCDLIKKTKLKLK